MTFQHAKLAFWAVRRQNGHVLDTTSHDSSTGFLFQGPQTLRLSQGGGKRLIGMLRPRVLIIHQIDAPHYKATMATMLRGDMDTAASTCQHVMLATESTCHMFTLP